MPTNLSSSLAQKLLFYGVSTGAAALAASAQADVHMTMAGISGDDIYFDPVSGAYSTSDSSLAFSLTTTATNETNPANKSAKSINTASAGGGVELNSNNYVINSPSTIDGTGTYGSGYVNRASTNSIFPYGTNATFQPGDMGTIGLQLQVNGTTDYGSADITFNGFGATNGAFTLSSFEYTDAAPEPSTVALLVAGAAGAAAWRRRRQAGNAA